MFSPSILTAFQEGIRRRIAAEDQFRRLNDGPDAGEQQQRAQLQQLLSARDAELAEIDFEDRSVSAQANHDYQARIDALDEEHRRRTQEILSTTSRAKTELEQKKSDSSWVVSSVLDDSADDSPVREFERFKTLVTKSREEQTIEFTNLQELVNKTLEAHYWDREGAFEAPAAPQEREQAAELFANATLATRKSHRQLQSLLLPKLFKGFRSLLVFVILTLVVTAPVYLYADPQLAGITGPREQTPWIVISLVVGAIGGTLLTLVVYMMASSQESDLLRQLQHNLSEVEWSHKRWLLLAKEQLVLQQKEFEVRHKVIERDRKDSLKRYELAHRERMQQIESDRAAQQSAEQQSYELERNRLLYEQRGSLSRLQATHTRKVAAVETRWSSEIGRLQGELDTYVSNQRRVRLEYWNELRQNWQQATQAFEAAIQQEIQADRRSFPDWNQFATLPWKSSQSIPECIRLGAFQINLAKWEGALSQDARLAPRLSQHAVPAAIPFSQTASVLFTSPNATAREQAIGGLQAMMLRLLTLLPPGKLRLTILDPVGLGESFGGFMHLADYDEMLVTSRIWTEANQIEARLADLTEHMENVLQKYLRNEFETIEEYNESAGEVAEPYHFLVISDFPAKFSEIAARRLVSIVNSGPRCGVYTLMNLDPGKQLPNNFQLADIESRMTRFAWKENAFYSTSPGLNQWPIAIDPPPRPEDFTAIVKKVGEASKDARRVEVSFSRITPDADKLWTGDSRSEVTIPLGRAGATKLQMLKLGKGTSQHMLVAGKTGSGKSTFLHILITNLALYYSPQEVNFFLIDFKKGVEFKDYATHHLPHALVIAVESDREFGVSALQRLGDILQERGELFRRHGVQDIAGYRNKTKQTMPRILLVIDEFQEFFIEDDKIGQNAALSLDRLVRQGRAFGIHVILGSQTLGGAYSLARSTLGQVAVRVALQCSEADAHLILSEDNTAARLLTRPGEAIYNDANGMFEGNHPFQIAWITDEQREACLNQMQQAQQKFQIAVEPPIVFEGNIPSDLTFNTKVSELVEQYPTRETAIISPTIWLGDSVEIAPATSLTFHRQNGNHLLLVGQDGDAAQGLMSAAVVTLAASLSPQQQENSLFILDGSHLGSPEAAIWEQVANQFESDVRIIRPLETTLFLQAILAELTQREETGAATAPPMFLLVYNIARFRDLRKAEEEFGMSSFGMGSSEPKPPEPGKIFADLLTRGPAVGIHTIIWCDSSNNIDRWFSRQSLREMEMRIAFQMNASDSSNLIDTPAASRLGTHRALLYREETGTTEKFRPYGVPEKNWLTSVHRRLQNQTEPTQDEQPHIQPPQHNNSQDDSTTDLEEFTIS